MFTPIRNLITYIQKNASGSTFFGGTTTNTEELTKDAPAATTMENEMIESILPTGVTKSMREPKPTSQMMQKELNYNENNNHTIENENLGENSLFLSTDNSLDPLNEKSDYNGDDYLEDRDDETEEKDIFLDFPPESDNESWFPASEVVVVNDLNVSINSEPSVDPLALDDYNVSLSTNSPNPLDSSTEGDVLFVVDIEEVVSQAPRLIDEVEDTRQLTEVKPTDEQELRSDGSDSGLGSETSTLQTTVTSVADTSVTSIMCNSPIVEKVPLRSNLKRRIQDVVDADEQQLQKKPRRSINFEGVKVFYFPRIQGHGCVPSQGGCTLGMGAHHISFKTFSLAEHAAELRRAHKLQLQEINPRGSSSEESDSDEELSEGSGSDLDAESNGFLQPVSPKQRRALLKAAGIRKIDASEKIECRDIRNSREVCGCVCRDFCDPDTCACSQAGIKCQVDRAMFPCGCSRDACGNVIGRIEFNPARVRTHFIHTIMRLDMENRQQKRTDELTTQIVASPNHLVYNNVPALASSSTTDINTYNPIQHNYNSLDQSTNNENYHHHMHQQYNVYNNNMPQTHPANGLCAQLTPTMMVLGASTVALPPTHNPYTNTTVNTSAGADCVDGGVGENLHYQDGSMYPPVMPPVVSYDDILTPFANTAPYDSNSTYSTTSVYNGYHSAHHQSNQVQPQQQFLGYTNSCNGDMSDFTDSHNSFISLNTPDVSSARLSAINDLLHSTRNTTVALVAVSPEGTMECVPCGSGPAEQLSQLPVPENCENNISISEMNTRPDTPPDEGLPPPPATTEDNNNQNKELLHNIVIQKDPESTPAAIETVQAPKDQKSQEPTTTEEKLQPDVALCTLGIKTGSLSDENGPSDDQLNPPKEPEKPEETSISSSSTNPPVFETALA